MGSNTFVFEGPDTGLKIVFFKNVLFIDYIKRLVVTSLEDITKK